MNHASKDHMKIVSKMIVLFFFNYYWYRLKEMAFIVKFDFIKTDLTNYIN